MKSAVDASPSRFSVYHRRSRLVKSSAPSTSRRETSETLDRNGEVWSYAEASCRLEDAIHAEYGHHRAGCGFSLDPWIGLVLDGSGRRGNHESAL